MGLREPPPTRRHPRNLREGGRGTLERSPVTRARSTLDSSGPQWLAYDGATRTSAASEVRPASPAVRNTVFSVRFER